ncbi:hypothetical protein ACIRO3_01900 [Streptomyces sp. NPDC102278]|uniref:hypothetical protein n=1 Tax=Streptomyces sp. NPDC102278 TaxID=3366152 RepID=UPI00380DFD77
MFIRPVGTTPARADRPPGRPLLRGLLARAAGAPDPGRHAARPTAPAAPDDRYEDRHEDRYDDRYEDRHEDRYEGGAVPAEPAPDDRPGSGGRPGGDIDAAPADAVRAADGPPGAGGLVSDLAQLADLAREGLLTPEEFANAKGRLLGR